MSDEVEVEWKSKVEDYWTKLREVCVTAVFESEQSIISNKHVIVLAEEIITAEQEKAQEE